MGNVKQKKFSDDNPNIIAILKYEQEIAALQEKYDKADEAHDWCMRHFYYNQMEAKRTNMEILKQKLGNHYPNASNSLRY